MGACASRPKDLKKDAPIPSEAPVSPRKPEVDPALEESKNEGETKKEEPLVDVSEPASEATKVEEAVAAEAVPVETPKPAVEEKAGEAAVKEEEEKEEVADKTEDKTEESNVKV